MSEMKVPSVSDISNSRMCKKSRAFSFRVKPVDRPANYTRTAIIKSTITSALAFHVTDPKEVMEYMKARYEECGFQNFQQKRVQLIWDHRYVMRYLNDETRTPIFPEAATVNVGSMPFRVIPDMAFVNGPKEIELVQIRIGKPINRKKEGMITDLKLFSMILYARQFGFQKIKASMYFLKKSTDSSDWARCSQNFFGESNIISMEDFYDGNSNQLDKQMESYIHILENGIEPEDVCENDCEHCDNYDLCKYLMPPTAIVKDPVVRSASSIQLTEDQQKAIEYDRGIVRINAGAGAGKTMVVALRIKRLVEKGVDPKEICCVTFTNAGAKEMLHRAELYSGVDLSEMTICTFNSFQNDIVLDCWESLGFSREPKVIDDIEKYSIIADLLKRNPIYEWTGPSFMNFFSQMTWGPKGTLQIMAEVFSAVKKLNCPLASITADEVRKNSNLTSAEVSDFVLDKIIKLYDQYDTILKKKGLIEFDDQEILTFRVIEQDPSYLARKYPFKHIIIDEFQDTSKAQIEFVKHLRMLPTFESLMVVGDDSQAIFGFRDTSPEFIIHFEEYMEEHVDDIFLLENHRSTPEIIDFANAINAMNIDKVEKDLIATRPHGRPVTVEGFYDQSEEYAYILNGIKAHLVAGFHPEDIAVIAFTKNELKTIADMLTKESIPSMFAAPEPVMENSRIRAILAFASLVKNRDDSKAAAIVANALSEGSLMDYSEDTIESLIEEVSAKAEVIAATPSLEAKKLFFIQMVEALSFGDETVDNFKDGLKNKDFEEIMNYCFDFALYGEKQCFRRVNEYPGVVLITAHSSKGLEYKVVYNTVSKYHKKEIRRRSELEEIRRLLFVSATRARDELYVTGLYNASQKSYGQDIPNLFLSDAFKAVGKTTPDFPNIA